ncbi:MAG: histidinol-phosphate transaminase [Bacillota bacterium]|nr:histidinol-phosphate transaminase [Bacillota bacterium]
MGRLLISEKVENIKPYIVDKREYEVKLDANESFIPFPKVLENELKEAAVRVLYNRYPDPDAEELCRLYGDYCGIASKYVMAGNGSDELIQILVNGFLDKEDSLLTIKPDFSMYKFYASLIGAKVVEYDMGEDLVFDRDGFMEMARVNNAKLVIFSSPNNPTGGIIPREDILYIVQNADALVVVDEAYFEFYGETVIDKISEYENLAVLRTCSKAVGLAAARVGFLIAGEKVIGSARKIKPPFNVNSLSQAAAAVVLKHREVIDGNVEQIKTGRDMLYRALTELQITYGKEIIRVFPTYANFVYVKSPAAAQIFEELKEAGIIIRCFGDYLRINTGSTKENELFIDNFSKFVRLHSGADA